jgi:hypothetical protein
MKPSPQLSEKLATTNLDELVVFHLAGREIAADRIARGHVDGDDFTDEENAFLAELVMAVVAAPRDYPRTDHLAPVTIVRNGMRAKFLGLDEGFWT